MTVATYVGIDLGATHVRAAVSDHTGAVRAHERGETPQGADGEAVARAVVETARRALETAGREPGDVVRVAIASIGPFDATVGGVVDPANLPGVDRIPLVEWVGGALGAPVSLHNDANAGAVGVRYFGETSPADLVYLTLSTGIGAGVVSGGDVLVGSHGNAAEVGHITLAPDADVRCGCGGVGHWEAFCGGGNIPALAETLKEGAAGEGEMLFETAADVFAAVDEDPLATRTVERVGHWNAVGVATLVQAYDPAVIVFGGAVARHNPAAILDPIRDRLPSLVLHDVPEVRLTDRGETAVVDGALACALTDEPGVAGVR